MVTYCALLRSINVGKHNRVTMAVLKEALSRSGFAHPASYLQSGNLAFAHDDPDEGRVRRLCEDCLAGLGLRGASAMVRSLESLHATASSRMFESASPDWHYMVAFTDMPHGLQGPFPLESRGNTVLGASEREVFFTAPRVLGSPPRALQLAVDGRAVATTVRFWNVVQDFAAFCDSWSASLRLG